MGTSSAEQRLLEKLRRLPSERAAEVEDFIDFLRQREDERALARAAMQLSEASLREAWDNPDDAVYDEARARPEVRGDE